MRGAAVFALAAGLFLAGLGRDLADQWIRATDLPSLSLQTSVEVVDRRGALLRVYTVADGRWRLGLRLTDVDPAFVTALLAYEDQRFYSHPGLDARAMLRAVAQAVWQGHVSSGGSTITMQVARLLEDSGTGHWAGKLRQIRLALALERRLSKAEILTLYLQLAPYGGNLEGLRAATLAYFGKEPLRLTPAQIALLVAIPQSPEARRPDRAVAAATDARDRVLLRAQRDGLIDADQLRAARSEVVPATRRGFPALAPHMADRVLAEISGQTRYQLTLDKTLQIKLEQLAREVVAAQGARLQVALVVADHASGEILASVGSAAY